MIEVFCNIEESRSVDTTLDMIEGFRLEAGYAASAFITDERRGAAHYDSPLLLVTDNKIDTVDQILPILEMVSRDGRPLVIVAEDIEGQALAALRALLVPGERLRLSVPLDPQRQPGPS